MPSQSWYEMADVRRRRLDAAVWIPLRASQTISRDGVHGFEGFREEFFGAASIAVPMDQRALAEDLSWSDVGIMHDHQPATGGDGYVTVDVSQHHNGVVGVRLVIAQRGNREEPNEWHLLPDFVVALALKREGDTWLAIDEGYQPVARLTREARDYPTRLEVRAEHLKDYLCARSMALYVNSFRHRTAVVTDAEDISWSEGHVEKHSGLDRWQGRVDEIHEGGMPYGAQTAVFHASRTDIDPSEDVPMLGHPSDADFHTESWTQSDEGRKLFLVRGELWRSEWVEPAQRSTRVRRDREPSTVSFIVDASGSQEQAASLVNGGRWLWFHAEVIPALAHRRGGALEWYTRDTGDVRCSPDYHVHFGVNGLGLVTVYAKDVALLPEWQQRIWAGANASPEGGVSEELLASQVRAEPAATLAPEAYLEETMRLVASPVSGSRFSASTSSMPSCLRKRTAFALSMLLDSMRWRRTSRGLPRTV
jgi:hypothetical protein